MSRAVIMAGWNDVPHLSDADKKALLESYPPHQRDARSKGIPVLGSGAIYPISEDDIVVPDFPLPAFWPRGYGMDVGWKATAAAWGAHDRDNDILYLYAEYKRGQAEPDTHAAAIKRRGEQLYGAIDPSSRGRNPKDGTRLMQEYGTLGLHLVKAQNAVEAGLFEVYQRMTTGRLKFFKSCVATVSELRIYHRDENGKVVKENDHLMDCVRYLAMTLMQVLQFWTPPPRSTSGGTKGEGSWMGT